MKVYIESSTEGSKMFDAMADDHRWEYKVVNPDREFSEFPSIEAALNHLGEQGWELVSFQLMAPITDSEFYAVFKRPSPMDIQNRREMNQ